MVVDFCLNSLLFADSKGLMIDLFPNGFVARLESRGLVEDALAYFPFGPKEDMAVGWRSGQSRFRDEYVAWRMGRDDDMPGWKGFCASPTGVSLLHLRYGAFVCDAFLMACKAEGRYWCQAYRDGSPRGASFSIADTSEIGFVVACKFDDAKLTGQPFSESDCAVLRRNGQQCHFGSMDDSRFADAEVFLRSCLGVPLTAPPSERPPLQPSPCRR